MTAGDVSMRIIGLLVLSLLAWRPATAGEEGIYESLSEVAVGRVFLSRAQRSMLDDGRGSQPVVRQTPTRPVVERPARKKQRRSAGYIVSSTGESRVWSARGFVATKPATGMRFPGDVVVTRSESGASETQTDVGGSDTESSGEGS